MINNLLLIISATFAHIFGFIHMKKLFGLFISLAAGVAWAQSWVHVNYDTGAGTPVRQVEGVLRIPERHSNGGALLILHHAGGFSFNTTKQYGEYFSKRGFVTLELKMFDMHDSRPDPITLHGQMMGGLKHLVQVPGVDPKKVSVMGLSLGAFMTVDAASQWFYEHYQAGELRFNKLIAMYPTCWIASAAANGDIAGMPLFRGMPTNFLQKWAHIPLLILAGAKDSYDTEDPNACPAFAKSIKDPKQAQITSFHVFPNATHAWDHGRNYSFPIWGGCTGRTNCTNRIVFSPETVELGKQAVQAFLIENN
jgi:dienelactone hydrolase